MKALIVDRAKTDLAEPSRYHTSLRRKISDLGLRDRPTLTAISEPICEVLSDLLDDQEVVIEPSVSKFIATLSEGTPTGVTKFLRRSTRLLRRYGIFSQQYAEMIARVHGQVDVLKNGGRRDITKETRFLYKDQTTLDSYVRKHTRREITTSSGQKQTIVTSQFNGKNIEN